MRRHALTTGTSFIASVALLVLVLGAQNALAGTGTARTLVGSFDGAATPAGSFSEPAQVAFDQTADVFYLYNRGTRVLNKLDPSGNPQDFLALATSALDGTSTPSGDFGRNVDIAVDNSGGANEGNIYLGGRESGKVFVFDKAGNFLYELDGSDTPEGSFKGVAAVTVDSAGVIHVASSANEAVYKYQPSGGAATYIPGSKISLADRLQAPFDLAIDSTDNLFVLNTLGRFPPSDAEKFDPSGTFLSVFDFYPEGDGSFAIAIDPSTDHVFVDRVNSVLEYDSSGVLLSKFGSADIGTSFGVSAQSSTGNVFVSSELAKVFIYGLTTVTVPDLTIGPATNLTASSATLNGTLDSLGVPSSFHFEYRRQGSDAWTKTSEETGSDGPVSVDVEHLLPNSTYEVKLVATNTDAGANVTSSIQFFTTATAPPLLITSPAAAATLTTATLSATLISNNSLTSYRFEYGKTTAYGNTAPPVNSGNAGSGYDPITVSETIGGLEPNIIYHYRVVIENGTGGPVSGPDHTFKTSEPIPEEGLLDNRQYEMVSPSVKGSAGVERGSSNNIEAYRSQVSPSGQSVVYASRTSFAGDSAPLVPTYIAHRDSSGWSTMGIAAPVRSGVAGGTPGYYRWFSEDLSFGATYANAALHPGDPPLEPGASGVTGQLYLRDTRIPNNEANAAFQLLAKPSVPIPVKSEEREGVTSMAYGSSVDNTHFVFDSGVPLTGDAPPLKEIGAYEWVNGTVRYAGILPNGSSVPSGGGNGQTGFAGNTYGGDHLISEDGSRFFFTSDGTVYVRENGSSTSEVGRGFFVGAKASDGSIAYIIAREDADTPLSQSLYRWDATAPPADRLTNLTAADPQSAGVMGLVGSVSQDATKIYFAATGNLAPGGVRGKPNIYLWQEGVGIKHIATLDGEISPGQSEFLASDTRDSRAWGFTLSGQAFTGLFARGGSLSTPDGNRLVFESHARLTPYDNDDHKQVYLYDLNADEITCVSCSRATSKSRGNSYLSIVTGTPDKDEWARFGRPDPIDILPQSISADGSRVFFDSDEPLLPFDTNGKPDVYEWEEGQLQLISTGSGNSDSTFLGAGASGDDVFFVTGEQLVAADNDELTDVYDARVDGIRVPVQRAPCVGDECQGTPGQPPLFSDLSSSRYDGPGNQPKVKKQRRKQHKVKNKRHQKKKSTSRRNSHNGRAGR